MKNGFCVWHLLRHHWNTTKLLIHSKLYNSFSLHVLQGCHCLCRNVSMTVLVVRFLFQQVKLRAAHSFSGPETVAWPRQNIVWSSLLHTTTIMYRSFIKNFRHMLKINRVVLPDSSIYGLSLKWRRNWQSEPCLVTSQTLKLHFKNRSRSKYTFDTVWLMTVYPNEASCSMLSGWRRFTAAVWRSPPSGMQILPIGFTYVITSGKTFRFSRWSSILQYSCEKNLTALSNTAERSTFDFSL